MCNIFLLCPIDLKATLFLLNFMNFSSSLFSEMVRVACPNEITYFAERLACPKIFIGVSETIACKMVLNFSTVTWIWKAKAGYKKFSSTVTITNTLTSYGDNIHSLLPNLGTKIQRQRSKKEAHWQCPWKICLASLTSRIYLPAYFRDHNL